MIIVGSDELSSPQFDHIITNNKKIPLQIKVHNKKIAKYLYWQICEWSIVMTLNFKCVEAIFPNLKKTRHATKK